MDAGSRAETGSEDRLRSPPNVMGHELIILDGPSKVSLLDVIVERDAC